MKKFKVGDEVICRVTNLSGHIYNVCFGPFTDQYVYDVMWDNLTSTKELGKDLISQAETVIPPKNNS